MPAEETKEAPLDPPEPTMTAEEIIRKRDTEASLRPFETLLREIREGQVT